MVRNALAALSAAFLVTLAGLVVYAVAQPPKPAAEKYPGCGPAGHALRSECVVVGKVVAVDKDTVEAAAVAKAVWTSPSHFDRVEGKVRFTVVTVKVESALLGISNTTHLKVGFDPKNGPSLAEGDTYLLFLSKHPTEPFRVLTAAAPPVPAKDEAAHKAAVAGVQKLTAVYDDPVKALKAEKADDRGFAALALIHHYRNRPVGVANDKLQKVELSEEESGLLLKGLADAEWGWCEAVGTSGYAMYHWLMIRAPKPPPPPGGGKAEPFSKAEYLEWLNGPEKKPRVVKLVPPER